MTSFVKGLAGLPSPGASLRASRPPRRPRSKTIHIGFQKYGTLILLKTQGLLEEKLHPHGYAIEWIEFPRGRNCSRR